MTRTLLFAAGLVVVASALCAQPESPSIIKMGNGLTLILREDHTTELIGVDVWVRAGSANETAKNNGVSHFIEHLVFGATATRAPGDMDLEMESIGATLDARTSKDWAHFSTTVSSRYLPKALDVLADALTGAQFRQQDVERERLIILDEISKKRTDPMRVCKDYVASELYGSHPYGLPVEGTPESVKAITRQMILDYYHKYYVPKNVAVVLVGDIDAQKATAEVGKAFQGLSNAPEPAFGAGEVTAVAQATNKTIKAPVTKTYLAIGFHGPPGDEYQDVCATDALLSYLGFGYRSWMEEELKGKMGLATAVSADFLTQKRPGAISLIAETSNANVDKVKGALFAKIAAVGQAGIDDVSLAGAKRSLLGQYAFENETFGGMANSYGFYFAVSDPAFAAKYVSCVQSITNQDIIRVAQKYLDPAKAVVLVITPEQGESQ